MLLCTYIIPQKCHYFIQSWLSPNLLGGHGLPRGICTEDCLSAMPFCQMLAWLPPFLSMAISLPCSARLTSYFLRVASFLTSSVWQFPYFLIWVDPFLSVGSFLLPSVGQFPPFLILTSSPTSLVWSSPSSVRLTSYFLGVASCITSWRFCSNIMFFSEAFLIPTPFIIARISSLFIFYFNFLHRTYHVLMCFVI